MASSELMLILSLLATWTPIAVSDGRNLNRRYEPQDFQVEEVKVWTGQTIHLKCGDTMTDSIRRFWRKDFDVLSAANVVVTSDERFSVYENSVELILANVTQDDAGSYICTVNTRPRYKKIYQMEIIELKCNHPDSPQEGGIQILSLGNNSTKPPTYESEEEASDGTNGTVFRFGARIQYYCNKGFAIVGDDIRTCTDPYKGGWSGEAPACEFVPYLHKRTGKGCPCASDLMPLQGQHSHQDESLADIRKRIGSIEDRISDPQTDSKGIAKLDLKMTNLEERMTKLESIADSSSKNLERIEGLDAEIHRVQAARNLGLHRSAWEKTLGHEVAQLGAKDGHVISEYAWRITDIYEKIDEHRSEKIKYVESPPFYTNVPGYKMQLHLYPDDGGSGHFGMYAVLLQGEFDEFIAWPFTSKFQLSMISRDENEVTTDLVVPSRVPACDFGRPPVDNILGCGFSRFMSHEDFKNKEKLYIYGKDVLTKITIYLDWH